MAEGTTRWIDNNVKLRGEPMCAKGSDGGEGRWRAEQQAMIDALSSELLDVQMSVRDYEERLAELYGTEDRSMWTGTPSLLADLQSAGGQVDSLENEVAHLRQRLHAVREIDDSFERRGDNSSSSPCGGEGGGMVASWVGESPLSRQKARVAQLLGQIAGLEEDNRILAHAAGWEMGDTSVEEEEGNMPTSCEQKRRLTAVELLRSRLLELAARASEAEEKENAARENESAARQAAEEASAGRDEADARTAELYSAAQHYKRGKLTAEEGMEALRAELAELRLATEIERADAACQAEEGMEALRAELAELRSATEAERADAACQAEEGVEALRVELTELRSAVEVERTDAACHVEEKGEENGRRLTSQGVQTEVGEGSCGVDARVERLNEELHTWREACLRANEQVRVEASNASATNQLLAEQDAMIRELEGRLSERTASQQYPQVQDLPADRYCSESEVDTSNTIPGGSGASTEEDTTWGGVRESIDTHRADVVRTNAQDPPAASTRATIATAQAATTAAAVESAVDALVHDTTEPNQEGAAVRSSANISCDHDSGSSQYETVSSSAFQRPGQLKWAADTSDAVAAAVAAVAAAAMAGGAAPPVPPSPLGAEDEAEAPRIELDEEDRFVGDGQRRRVVRGGEGAALEIDVENASSTRTPTMSESEALAAVSSHLAGSSSSADGRRPMHSFATGDDRGAYGRQRGRTESEEDEALARNAAANSSAETVMDHNRVNFDVSAGAASRRPREDEIGVAAAAMTTAMVGADGAVEEVDSGVGTVMSSSNGSRGYQQDPGASTSSVAPRRPVAQDSMSTSIDSTASSKSSRASHPQQQQLQRQQQQQGRRRRRQLPSSGLTEVEGFSVVSGERPLTRCDDAAAAQLAAERAAERAENAADRADRAADRARWSFDVAQRDRIATQTATTEAVNAAAAVATAPIHGSQVIPTGERWNGETVLSRRQAAADAEAAADAADARREKRARRAARLAKRAAVAARLQHLAEATAAEETISSASYCSSTGSSVGGSIAEERVGGEESPASRLAERAAVVGRFRRLAEATAAEETISSASYCSSARSSRGESMVEERGGGEESPVVRDPARWETGGGQLPRSGWPTGGPGAVANGNGGGVSPVDFGTYPRSNIQRMEEVSPVEEVAGEEKGECGSVEAELEEHGGFRYLCGTRGGGVLVPEREANMMRHVQWVEQRGSPLTMPPNDSSGGRPRAEEARTHQRHDAKTRGERGYEGVGVTTMRPLAVRPGRASPLPFQMPRVEEEDSQAMHSQLSGGEMEEAQDVEDIAGERDEEWVETSERDRGRPPEYAFGESWGQGSQAAEKNQHRWPPAGGDDTCGSSFADQNTAGTLRPGDLGAGTPAGTSTGPADNLERWQYWQRPVMEAASEKSATSVVDDSFPLDRAGAAAARIANTRRESTDHHRFYDEADVESMESYDGALHDGQEPPAWGIAPQAMPETGGRLRESSNLDSAHAVRRGRATASDVLRRPEGAIRHDSVTASGRRREFSALEGEPGDMGGKTGAGTGRVKRKKKKVVKRGTKAASKKVEGAKLSGNGRRGEPLHGNPHAELCLRTCADPTCRCGSRTLAALSSPAMWHSRRTHRPLSGRAR